MSEEQKKEEAARFAKRAAAHGKNAAKNVGKAAKVAAEVAEETVEEKAHDAVRAIDDKAEDAVGFFRGADARLVLASLAVTIGGTYLIGRVVGYHNAKADLAAALTADPVDPVV